jgi:hypothetical protein
LASSCHPYLREFSTRTFLLWRQTKRCDCIASKTVVSVKKYFLACIFAGGASSRRSHGAAPSTGGALDGKMPAP